MTHQEILMAFYDKALTVNKDENPAMILEKILDDQFVSHGSVATKSKEELSGQLGYFWKLIPDLQWKVQDILQQENTYVVRSIATGTPSGDFMGIATNGTKSFKIMTIDIHTIQDGKITQVYHIEDWATAIQQLKS